MVAALALVVPIVIGIVSFTWWLSGRMATQDSFLSMITHRLARIEKHLGMSAWNGDDHGS